MCKRLCGFEGEPANRKDAYWWRKRFFENHGEWPKSVAAKRKEEDAKASENAAAMEEEEFHPALSTQMKWAIKNPDNAKFDNDGNPVTSEHWGFDSPKGKIDPNPSH